MPAKTPYIPVPGTEMRQSKIGTLSLQGTPFTGDFLVFNVTTKRWARRRLPRNTLVAIELVDRPNSTFKIEFHNMLWLLPSIYSSPRTVDVTSCFRFTSFIPQKASSTPTAFPIQLVDNIRSTIPWDVVSLANSNSMSGSGICSTTVLYPWFCVFPGLPPSVIEPFCSCWNAMQRQLSAPKPNHSRQLSLQSSNRSETNDAFVYLYFSNREASLYLYNIAFGFLKWCFQWTKGTALLEPSHKLRVLKLHWRSV